MPPFLNGLIPTTTRFFKWGDSCGKSVILLLFFC